VEADVQIDWFTFIAQIVNFLILIGLLHRFLYKPVIKAMDEREQKIAAELEEARLKKVEAEQKEHDFTQKVREIEQQKDQMLEEARQKAELQKQEMMEEIRAEINSIKRRWEEAVESEKEAFLNQLQHETAEQIVVLIETILSDLSDYNLQEQTVNIFLDKLENIDKTERNHLQNTIDELQIHKAIIYSAFELNGLQKHQITDLLRKISALELECEFEVAEDLGFGLEVRIGGWNIGWNLKRYIDGIYQEMRDFFLEQSAIRHTSEFE